MACLARSPQDWLNSTQLCANPANEDFTPKKGPVGGKTKVRSTAAAFTCAIVAFTSEKVLSGGGDHV